MSKNEITRNHQRWASFRLSVVGPLLASPPEQGQLQEALEDLAMKLWIHPINGTPCRYAFPTIQQWYYTAKAARLNPVDALGQKIRKDTGSFKSVGTKLRIAILSQHKAHKSWSHQLHYDNLVAWAEQEQDMVKIPSYATIRRFRVSSGLVKEHRVRNSNRPGAQRAARRLEKLEVRSYEVGVVHGLWHADFHHCSRQLLNANGDWVKPVLLAFLDDRSRLICHIQWYWHETAENFIHGLCQAIQKRGLPRALMTDNGTPMLANETTQGLTRLSLIHETTLPYSPYQNGKQEVIWAQVEGRMMAMLENKEEITLSFLNKATLAWVEMEYHQKVNSETGQTPIKRYLKGPDVGRPSPSSEDLRLAFGKEEIRRVRRSDGSISLEAKRYEIPSRYRHLREVVVRYASWDLSKVYLVNNQTGDILCRITPCDRSKNADGRRKTLNPLANSDGTLVSTKPDKSNVAPLMKQYLEDYSATGLPPGYLPKADDKASQEKK